MKVRIEALCQNGCSYRQDTSEIAVAFGAQTCPRCGGAVELRRVRVLKQCCAAEDGQECLGHCPRVRRSA